MKLLQQLQQNEFTLLVSLPRNDVELAKAAIRGGAQGLKIHINVHHFASGTKFGSFEEEKENLARIIDAAGEASVGIVPGGSPFATEEEFGKLADLGIDYFDAYPPEIPAWALRQKSLDKMLAAFDGASLSIMQSFEALGMQLCEASIMAHDDYGKPLNTLDLARYYELASGLKSPIVVPSQKKIVPGDIPALKSTGAKALLIGAIVTGREADTLEAAARSFADVIER